jgi:fatty acid desaturase
VTEARPDVGPEAEEEQRKLRANRATRGAMAGVLGLEAIVTLLVPRALAFSDGGLGMTKTVLLVVLAVAMIAAAGLLRRAWGVGSGSVLQVVFVLSGLWLFALLVVAVLFAAVWGRLLWLRHQLLGTPSGWRLLLS